MNKKGGSGQEDGNANPAPTTGLWSVVRRASVFAVGLVASWALGFFGPGLWESAKVATGQDPLAVAVLRDYQVPTSAEFHYNQVIVPHPLSKYPWEPYDPDELSDPLAPSQGWEYSSDEVDAITTAVRLVFTGTRSASVIVQQLSVRVLARRLPLRGIITVEGAQGGEGEAMERRYLRADLDSGKVTWRTGENKPTAAQALLLDRGDQVIVDLIAVTLKCDCDWVVDVTYSAGSETGTMTVPSRGHFRTSALSRAAVWDASGDPRPTCEDYRDLKPTICDKVPANFEGPRLSVIRRSRVGKFATGYGLMAQR